MEIEKLRVEDVISAEALTEWCEGNTVARELIATAIAKRKLKGYRIIDQNVYDLVCQQGMHTNAADKIKTGIKNNLIEIRGPEFWAWYDSEWEPEKKPAVFMSKLLTIAIQCNKELYANGVPKGATSHTENYDIRDWLEAHYKNLTDADKKHIRFVKGVEKYPIWAK